MEVTVNKDINICEKGHNHKGWMTKSMPDIPKMPVILSFLVRNKVTLADVRGNYNIRYFVGFNRIFIKIETPCYTSCYNLVAPKFSDVNKTSIDLLELKQVGNNVK
jgi:hypothetical protein